MVKLRLARMGTHKRPFYHIVATDSRSCRDGRYIERVGYFNPVARGNDKPLHVDMARVDYWLGVGAQASDVVDGLIKRAKAQPAA